MLLNNFKPLLFFGGVTNAVKTVTGSTTYVGGVTYPLMQSSLSTNNINLNGHEYRGVVRCFNYNTTTDTNNYTDEQTTYTWEKVINNDSSSSATSSAYWGTGFVLFTGEGNTPVTADDYKLDTPLSLSVTSASCTHNNDGTTVTTRTFQNNTENDVTVKELGLYVFQSKRVGGASPIVMIGRKVLSTPVTISVGASYIFTWTIDLVKDLQFTED